MANLRRLVIVVVSGALGTMSSCARSTEAEPARGNATPLAAAAPMAGDHTLADWPMPNQPGAGLPNEQRYAVMTVGSDEVVRDQVTGLTWQRQPAIDRYDWPTAMQACQTLVLAGWDDWRVPSRIELVSLLDLTRTDPSINTDAFPSTQGEWFWSASVQADNADNAWFVYFYFGYPDTEAKASMFPVRCVR